MPQVTAVFAAVFALMFVAMSADTAYQRNKHRVPLQGFGDNKYVNRAVRVHGNFAEHVPMALLLMLLLELRGAGVTWLAVAGGALLVGRSLHWIGIKGSSGLSFGRYTGVGLTWLVLVGQALALLWSVTTAS